MQAGAECMHTHVLTQSRPVYPAWPQYNAGFTGAAAGLAYFAAKGKLGACGAGAHAWRGKQLWPPTR